MSIVLITGSSGLVGSESVNFFSKKGFDNIFLAITERLLEKKIPATLMLFLTFCTYEFTIKFTKCFCPSSLCRCF